MMILPLPPVMLDVLFTFNIALSLIIIMAVFQVRRPLEFAIFPTVLLLVTILRLALNVASTRVVLMHGHEGPHAAGKVIAAFGEFVIGGNYAVGAVVFIILTIINFVVVTKGAGRVSEVSARFALDAMPGKQMAIDADLNAGLITQDEARAAPRGSARRIGFLRLDGRRQQVRARRRHRRHPDPRHQHRRRPADRHDDARPAGRRSDAHLHAADDRRRPRRADPGPAAVGRGRHHRHAHFARAGRRPGTRQAALRPAEGAGRRGRRARHHGPDPGHAESRVPLDRRPVRLGCVAHRAEAQASRWSKRRRPSRAPAPAPENQELSWEDVRPVDVVGLEVGYRLVPLVDRTKGGDLLARIRGIRRKLTQELGFLVQPVHIRDNLELGPNSYRIRLAGVAIGENIVHPDRELAINPGRVFGTLNGIATRDPAFGMEAVWIEPSMREHAQSLGYTVVDAATVIATHLSHLVQMHAHELFGHEEAEQLLKNLSKASPKLVEELVPKVLPLATVVRVMQGLLAERVPIRNVRAIVEALAEAGPRTQDTQTLIAQVRVALGRQIVQDIVGLAEELPVITLEPELERLLSNGLSNSGASPGLEPGLADRLQRGLQEAAERQERGGEPAVLLTPPALRAALARFFRVSVPGLHVLAWNELPDNRKVRMVTAVGSR